MIRTATLTAILSSLLLAAGFQPAVAYTHHFTSIHFLGSFETVMSDINNAGQAVGTYNRRHGFLQTMIFPLGINNEGTVVGMQVKLGSLKTRGFIYEDGEFRFIGPYRRGLNYIGGINDEGHMAGYSSKLGAYLYDGTTFTPISYSFPLFPLDLNISDQVVGFYFGGDRRAHGFLYNEGNVLTIDYPGATLTFLTGINDRGDLSGWYREGGTNHSFVATPVPIPGSVWLLGAGLLGLALTSQSLLPSFRPRRLFMQK